MSERAEVIFICSICRCEFVDDYATDDESTVYVCPNGHTAEAF